MRMLVTRMLSLISLEHNKQDQASTARVDHHSNRNALPLNTYGYTTEAVSPPGPRVGALSHSQDYQVSVGCKEVEYEDYWKKTRLREPLLSARDQQ
jgi:hypothetical protein